MTIVGYTVPWCMIALWDSTEAPYRQEQRFHLSQLRLTWLMTNIMFTHILLLSFSLHNTLHNAHTWILLPLCSQYCYSYVSCEIFFKNILPFSSIRGKTCQKCPLQSRTTTQETPTDIKLFLCVPWKGCIKQYSEWHKWTRLNLDARLPLCSTHISTNASSESRTIMTPHCACFSPEKTKTQCIVCHFHGPLYATASCRYVGDNYNCVEVFHKPSQTKKSPKTWEIQPLPHSQTEMISSSGIFIVDEFLLLHNTAEPPSQLSNTTWECQHVNAKHCAPADMISSWRATSGDWRNQKLSGDLSTAGPSETS